jgi:8-hydroxy-5-deazaflavin:NADPH oxidoreductase
MKIGILGSGLMGAKLGAIWARAGHEIAFSYARDPRKLEQLARDAGTHARAVTPRDAVAHADAVLVAVNWPQLDDVLAQAGELAGKVIITCALPMVNEELAFAHTWSGAEELAKRLATSHVVAAFGTVPSECLFGVFESQQRPHLIYYGDDANAKPIATQLIADAPGSRRSISARSAWRDTRNHSRCSSVSSRMAALTAPTSPIDSNGSSNDGKPACSLTSPPLAST